jgi:hypothetical protein
MTQCPNVLMLSPSPNVCHVWLFTSTLIIYFIKKLKLWKKIKCILKLLCVINHIIFDFFITLILFNKPNGQSWRKKSNATNI